MDENHKLTKIKDNRIITYFVLVALTFIFSDFSSLRHLWYDEALTIMEFISLPGYLAIYRHYVIANNHIVFNILLKLWIEGWALVMPLGEFTLRLFSVTTACIMICLLWQFGRKKFGFLLSCFLTLTMITMPFFPVYATAVRGYMLSMMFAVIAMIIADKLVVHSSIGKIFSFALVSFLLVGTIPSNLLFLGGLACVLIPERIKGKQLRNWSLLCIIPPIMFLLFYLPIFPKLLKVANRTGGWHSSFLAAADFYLPFVIFTFPALLLIICFFISSLAKRNFLFSANRLTVWSIRLLPVFVPLILFFVRTSTAPFPRVFILFYILYFYLILKFLWRISAVIKINRGGKRLKTMTIYFLLVSLLWNLAWFQFRGDIREKLVPVDSQDDTLYPYFMGNFDPLGVVLLLKKLLPQKDATVFISPMADPPSLIFYGRGLNVPMNSWTFDKPGKSVDSDQIMFQKPFFLVVRGNNDLEAMKKRFNLNEAELVRNFGFHKLYLVNKINPCQPRTIIPIPKQ